MIVLILANVAAVALETVPGLWARYSHVFFIFDMVSVAIFTAEYLLRVWSSAEYVGAQGRTNFEKRCRYIVSPLAVVDLLAILPFYLGAFINLDLRALRIFRLLRLFKLVRYSPAITSLSRVFVRERHALFAAFLIMIGILFVTATLAHLIEGKAQPAAFGTIPDALWWSLTTLTTVGYGDVVPITDLGRILGAFVMLVGFAFYAVPIGIIASGFADEVHQRAFVVPVRLIENVPIFQGLDPSVAKEIANHLRTLNVPPGTVVTHKMDVNNGLYCIVSGDVVAFHHHRPIELQGGDFFGELGIVSEDGDQPSTITRSWVRLMKLDSVDLHTLLSVFPEMSSSVLEYANKRLADFVESGCLDAEERSVILEQLRSKIDRG
ncbi:MAG: ion transporter [Kordiimonadaceae bacterium]|nr:ion transporter [Kordiimonadaceae bacterium]MBO6570085.1 ion transporter [Kordiimonadaceae bacterium]MBO6965818.1 ion transporter [Kordiimonadaceae bacterium]